MSFFKGRISRISQSVLITFIFFAVFLLFCKPIIDSDDNFFILYTLAGGYGNAPTTHLHYYYEWHPILFWPAAMLFSLFPSFNWYTLLLLVLQFWGCVYLLFIFLDRFSTRVAIGVFLVFFLFFESVFLLSLNHSNTSFLLAISGCTGILHFEQQESVGLTDQRKIRIVAVLLIVASGLLRLHTMALYVALTLGIGLILLPPRRFKKPATQLLLTSAMMLVFTLGQIVYYNTLNSRAAKEEKFRQSLFHLANHPVLPPGQDTGILSVKNSFVRSWFLFDSSFVTEQDLASFSEKNVYNRLSQAKGNGLILYWTFINNRVYILLLGSVFLFLMATQNTRTLFKWLLTLLPGVSIFLYLFLFAKVTEGILVAILCSFFLSAVLCLRFKDNANRSLSYISLSLLCFVVWWMLVLIKKRNEKNLSAIRQTRSVLNEIGASPDKLFIATLHFTDRGFYIWDSPQQFPLTNLVSKELLITDSYREVLNRFHIKDLMKSLPQRSDVFLIGPDLPYFEAYYKITHNLDVKLENVPYFRHMDVYQLRPARNK